MIYNIRETPRLEFLGSRRRDLGPSIKAPGPRRGVNAAIYAIPAKSDDPVRPQELKLCGVSRAHGARLILTQESREAGDLARNYSGDVNCITEQRNLSSLRGSISRILDLTFQLIAVKPVKPNRARWTLRLRLEDGDLRRSEAAVHRKHRSSSRSESSTRYRALDSTRTLANVISACKMETHVSWNVGIGKTERSLTPASGSAVTAEAIAIAPFVGARNGVNARRAFRRAFTRVRRRAHARYNVRSHRPTRQSSAAPAASSFEFGRPRMGIANDPRMAEDSRDSCTRIAWGYGP